MKKGFYWFDASGPDRPVFYRYIKKEHPGEPRVYFGDVYRRQGIGQVESRIYCDAGDSLKTHRSIAEAKAYIEAEEKKESNR